MEAAADTLQKALRINLDPRWYGTIAEIGAGQEVARWFFRAGGAAGTVAKTISAYDMAVSDAVYGKSERYVSKGRLQAMLDHEYALNLERLETQRGDDNAFFAFADTVVARSYRGGNECHGWMGVKFQSHQHDDQVEAAEAVGQLPVDVAAHVGAVVGHDEDREVRQGQGDGAEDRMEIGIIQGIQRLSQTAIMQGLRRQAGLQQG